MASNFSNNEEMSESVYAAVNSSAWSDASYEQALDEFDQQRVGTFYPLSWPYYFLLLP